MDYVRLLTLCGLLLSALGALAGRVELPLGIPLELIGRALSAQAGVVYREGPCRYVELYAPKLEPRNGRLRFLSAGTAGYGVELLGSCQHAALWRGTVELMLEPQLDGAGRLRMRVVDSQLEDTGADAAAVALVWNVAKSHVHAQLERFSYDIGALRAPLQALGLPQPQLQAPRIEAGSIVVPVAFEVPDAWLTPPPAGTSAAPLTEAELDTLERALQPWDAFLVYSIKQVALDSEDGALRGRLFTLLLESRYRLAAILSGEAPLEGDPLRALFIETWDELRAILADTRRYALFLEAGDALRALERAAPGLRLSADGLRQLARSLRPGETGDPLAYALDVDPQLRRLFDVEELVEPAPARSWLDYFVTSAHAAAQALDPWVPRRHELEAYEARIGELLQKAAAAELARAGLAAPYDRIYRDMVPTTALIESCWRQYVRRGGKIRYLRSGAGSVGIMQINQVVWRGFYDLQRLRWDTAYNARAGARILMRYLKDYAIPYAERSGELDHVPRAAYAVYNAGPRAVGRFNKARPHPREARVDRHLWKLYQGIAAGGRADLRTCGVGTKESPT